MTATTVPLHGLRERRLFRNISQVSMAALIDLQQSHYRRIETGEIRLDVHRALVLARSLGCSIEELM
jgi:transcriptional regulator with XRE-family HTH domain